MSTPTQLYGTTEAALLGTVLRPEEVSVEGPTSAVALGGSCLLGVYLTKVVDGEVTVGAGEGSGELAIPVARGRMDTGGSPRPRRLPRRLVVLGRHCRGG